MTPRRLGPLALLCALAAAPTAPAADPPIVVERLRVGLSEVPTAGVFKEGTWTPVAVDLAAGPARFVGYLEVLSPDDDGTAVVARVPIDLKAKESRTYTTYLRPGVKAATFLARAVDESGRPQGKEKEESGPDWIESGQKVVALLGSPRGVDEIGALPSFATPNSPSGGSDLRVVRVRPPRGAMSPGSVPGRWYGYDVADVVILDTGDDAIMADLAGGGKAAALEDWVRQGGHLVVAGATKTQMLADNAILRRMLPAVPVESVTLNDLGALESYAGSARFGRNVKALSVARLEVAPGHSSTVLASTVGSTPTNLVVRGAWGFGRVTVLGLDTGLSPFADWPGARDLWVKVLDLKGRPANTPGAIPNGAFYQGGAHDIATVLQQSLERFPGVKLVPFGVVAAFVFLYILMIGPGDYFFLKKVLKRMELTWVTFPLIVVGVSTAAYLAAYAIKGSDLRVNKVDAVDIDQSGPGEPSLRGHSWISLFSPHNRDYGVAFDPKAVDADAAPTPAKGADRTALVSWFGSPEPILRGGNGAGLAGSPYRQVPDGEAEALEGVRVAIWSTKGFGARWSGTAAPAVDADLTPVGTDRLTGTVVNRLKVPMRNVWVAFGNQVFLLGDLAPGGSSTVELASNRVLATVLEEMTAGFQQMLTSNGGPRGYVPGPNGTWVPAGRMLAPASRSDTVRVAMFRDLMATRAGALASVPMRELDLTGHLALGRAVLVATVGGEGSTLRLSGNAYPPIIDHETVLRVILPLKPEAAEPK